MRRRKLSVAVTWSSSQPTHRVYYEQDVEALIAEMQRARVVVGYNCRNFDFQILRGYRPFKPKRSLDLFANLATLSGQKPIPISSVWKGTFGDELKSDGLERMELWRSGQLPLLVQSCVEHLSHIRKIHEFGVEHGYVAFVDRFRELRKVKVDWNV